MYNSAMVQPVTTLSASADKNGLQIGLFDDAEGLRAGLLGLSQTPGVGLQSLKKLYRTGFFLGLPSAPVEDLVERAVKVLSGASLEGVREALGNREKVMQRGRKVLGELRAAEIHVTFEHEKSFPRRLRDLAEPPLWIFYRGSLKAIWSRTAVALIGTRSPSDFGARLALNCGFHLATRGHVVLSGLARGIDQAAHEGCLEAGGITVAVLAQGLASDLSSTAKSLANEAVANEGAVVSEYLPFDPPNRSAFLRRNEIIAALARLVVPVEYPEVQSGTGATVRRAMAIKRPLAGISSSRFEGPASEATQRNLRSAGITVYDLHNGEAERFWTHVAKLVDAREAAENRRTLLGRRAEHFARLLAIEAKSRSMDPGEIDSFLDLLTKAVRRSIAGD
ncbi:MAG: DNA-processing protein DprA [Bacteroidota bacterium]